MFLNSKNQRDKVRKSEFYFLGLVSTWQIIEIFGVNIFTLLVFFIAIKYIIKFGKFPVGKGWFLFFFSTMGLSTLGNLFLSDSFLQNVSEWRKYTLNGVLIIVALYVVLVYLKKDYGNILSFFLGLYHSCLVQLIWCYLQLFFIKVFNLSINSIIFSNGVDQYNISNNYVITGLHTNAGILASVLMFLFLFSNSTTIKLLSLAVFFLAGSSTLIICGISLIVISILFAMKEKRKKIKGTKRNVLLLLIIICTFAFAIILGNNSDNIGSNISDLFSRFRAIRSRRFEDGSTFAHFRYYASIPFIFGKLNAWQILFGFGFKCGGIPFVKFFNQYPDVVYSTESDPISFLYGLGIIGTLVFYTLLFTIIAKGKKKNYKISIWGIVITIAGIFYGMQLNWVILLEWIFCAYINNKINYKKCTNTMYPSLLPVIILN